MLDLMRDAPRAEPDEQRAYFYLGTQPHLLRHEVHWYGRVTVWEVPRRDGTVGTFTSRWFGRLQYYYGDAKADGTRSRWYWDGRLDDGRQPTYLPDSRMYVYTDLGKELKALRWVTAGPGEPRWDNMGGS